MHQRCDCHAWRLILSLGSYPTCLAVLQYEEAKKAGATSAEEKQREDAAARIAKYQFHFERFAEYEKSIKAAVRQISETERRMEMLQDLTGGDLQSVEFLLEANRTVIECRRALKWSYVISFYLQPNSRQLAMFQIDQGQLEQFSDELHGLIELPLDQLIPTASPTTPTASGASKSSAAKPSATKPSTTVSSATSPNSASSSSAGTPAPKPRGDDLKKLIQIKTNTANKYLSSLIDAVMSGQYLDLDLKKASSIGEC
jgi:hypothetical protein